jgi:hypothetical protein
MGRCEALRYEGGGVMSWRLNAGNETEVMDARGRNVARAHCGGSYGVKLDEAEAHARLIAAAPDMLAALEALLDDALALGLADSHLSGSAIEARTAINKAKGNGDG